MLHWITCRILFARWTNHCVIVWWWHWLEYGVSLLINLFVILQGNKANQAGVKKLVKILWLLQLQQSRMNLWNCVRYCGMLFPVYTEAYRQQCRLDTKAPQNVCSRGKRTGCNGCNTCKKEGWTELGSLMSGWHTQRLHSWFHVCVSAPQTPFAPWWALFPTRISPPIKASLYSCTGRSLPNLRPHLQLPWEPGHTLWGCSPSYNTHYWRQVYVLCCYVETGISPSGS